MPGAENPKKMIQKIDQNSTAQFWPSFGSAYGSAQLVGSMLQDDAAGGVSEAATTVRGDGGADDLWRDVDW